MEELDITDENLIKKIKLSSFKFADEQKLENDSYQLLKATGQLGVKPKNNAFDQSVKICLDAIQEQEVYLNMLLTQTGKKKDIKNEMDF